jgi:DNA-binding NarL/FixJ family response regulator
VRIEHDKISGALYIKLREGEYDHTEDFSEGADVYLDVDAEGYVLGLEALSFEDLAQAIEKRGGKLHVPERIGGAEAGEPGAITPRQREVLRMLAEGMNNREIAERLSVSLATVRRDIAGMAQALAPSDRSGVAVWRKPAAG